MEEEEEEVGSGRGLCTLNTQADVLLLTRASFSHSAFAFLPPAPKTSPPHLVSRVPFSLSPGWLGSVGWKEMKPHKC